MNFKNSHYKKIILFSVFMCSIFYLAYMPASANKAFGYGNGRGRYLFNYYNCIDCHIANANGSGGTLGPSLSNYGNSGKSYGWTVTQIKNPRSHYKVNAEVKINGKKYYAVMPAYSYIPYVDIERLASYIESLKK
jgi:mono/diheme cytochrome c family protein